MTTPAQDVAKYDGPQSPQDRWKYAEALAQAGLLPEAFRRQPGNVFYAVEYGRALNIAPIAAITGINVIEGKPTASAGLMSALVRRAGHQLRTFIEGTVEGGDIKVVCEIVRFDDADHTFRSTWTLDRALRAELIDNLVIDEQGRTKVIARTKKGYTAVWQKYPEALLKARAISEAARDACEEALCGVHYTAEELGANVELDGNGEFVIVGEVVPDTTTPPSPGRRPEPEQADQVTVTVTDVPKAAQEQSQPPVTPPAPPTAAPAAAEPAVAPQDGPTPHDVTAAHGVAAQAMEIRDVDELKALYRASTPLLDIDISRVLTHDEAAFSTVPDGAPIPLRAWLIDVSGLITREGMSVRTAIQSDAAATQGA